MSATRKELRELAQTPASSTRKELSKLHLRHHPSSGGHTVRNDGQSKSAQYLIITVTLRPRFVASRCPDLAIFEDGLRSIT